MFTKPFILFLKRPSILFKKFSNNTNNTDNYIPSSFYEIQDVKYNT